MHGPYKTLYAKKDRREANLNLLLNEFNIPKVKESDKVKLEGHITYSFVSKLIYPRNFAKQIDPLGRFVIGIYQ